MTWQAPASGVIPVFADSIGADVVGSPLSVDELGNLSGAIVPGASVSGPLPNSVVTLTLAANGSAVVPAGYAIRDIFVNETANNAITGGLDIGTTAAGTDIQSALAVAGDAFVHATLSKRQFSASVAQTVFFTAHTAWNSASVNIVITLDRAIP